MMKFFQCQQEGLVIPVTHSFMDETHFNEVKEIIPNSVDAAKEKHVPVVTVEDHTVKVNVGEVEHPMTEKHLITTVILETNHGGQYQYLTHEGKPVVTFSLSDGEKPLAVYAYCNLHGLWKVEI